MNLIPDTMLLNYIALALVYLLSVEDIMSLNPLYYAGISALMAQENRSQTSPIALIPSIPMHIRTKKSNGFEIYIDAIHKSLSVNYTERSADRRASPDTLILFIVFIEAWVIPARLLPQNDL